MSGNQVNELIYNYTKYELVKTNWAIKSAVVQVLRQINEALNAAMCRREAAKARPAAAARDF